MSVGTRLTPSVSETTSKVPRGTLYRGREGMWSWVLHRITGVAIFFFLLVHVLDTALIRLSPEAYNAVIGTYKNPIMALGEVVLVGRDRVPRLQRPAHHRGRPLAVGHASSASALVGRPGPVGGDDGRLRAAPPDARLRDGRRSLMTTIADPRSPHTTVRRSGPNLEKWGWIYMRVSGVFLVVLIFGHLFVNLMVGEGIHGIDFAFVAGKYASPFWQWWDVLMLWFALIHGANGMRTITNDYIAHPKVRRVLVWAIGLAAALPHPARHPGRLHLRPLPRHREQHVRLPDRAVRRPVRPGRTDDHPR